ncbi:MAG: hypothetical protein PHE43_04350 [Candidatus Nanoarchaeia archaeon]|nr:hypothetical protein [Candidatus Nanoarchaeia archaeon]
MNKNNLTKFVLVLLVLIIFLSVQVKAIGITPGKVSVDFEANKKETFNFKVLNNEKKDMQVVLYVEKSDLSSMITMYNSLVELSSSEESKDFKFDLTLPENIEEPGTHQLKIIALEIPSTSQGESFVGATAAVALVVEIKVPYPGKYAKISLDVSDAQAGDYVNFVVPISNFGTEKINQAKATIDILGPTNEKITTITTNEISIESKDKKEVTAQWKADANPGAYHAVATLTYDGNYARAEKTFYIGNLLIEIIDIESKNFQLGQVAKFTVTAESKWNDRINDVNAQVIITDEEGTEAGNFKSANVNFEPLSKQELLAYWDTEFVKEGTYDAKIILNYQSKTTEKNMKAYITLGSIRFSNMATGQAVSSKGLGTNTILTVLVIILIIINVSWFIYIKRRNKLQKTI